MGALCGCKIFFLLPVAWWRLVHRPSQVPDQHCHLAMFTKFHCRSSHCVLTVIYHTGGGEGHWKLLVDLVDIIPVVVYGMYVSRIAFLIA